MIEWILLHFVFSFFCLAFFFLQFYIFKIKLLTTLMRTLSAFQCLPIGIAETICSYVISTAVADDYKQRQNVEINVWCTLYNVSFSWRILALKYFFQSVTLKVSANKKTGYLVYCNVPEQITYNMQHYNYVKAVDIQFEGTHLPTATAILDKGVAIWPENVTFPLATLLNINLEWLANAEINEQHYRTVENEGFVWLSQCILNLMPRLQEITINDFTRTHKQVNNAGYLSKWKADMFLQAVFSKIRKLVVKVGAIYPTVGNSLASCHYTGLTHLHCESNDKNEYVNWLLERSALTLVSLRFIDAYLINAGALVFDSNRKPLVYPQLQKLEFINYSCMESFENYHVDKNVAPFPALRHLIWSSRRIFDDDTLFRENSQTLEYLKIETDTWSADILQKQMVFTDNKFSKLSNVSIYKTGPIVNRLVDTVDPDAIMKLAQSLIGPETKNFEINFKKPEIIMQLFSTSQHLENIRTLCLSRFKGTLDDLLEITRLLPNMESLECLPGRIEYKDKKNSENFKKFVDDYHKQHYPVSSRLRRWNAMTYVSAYAEVAANTALALAILCPSFGLAYIPRDYQENYKENIGRIIEDGFFSEHMSKIQRLLRY